MVEGAHGGRGDRRRDRQEGHMGGKEGERRDMEGRDTWEEGRRDTCIEGGTYEGRDTY